MKRSEKIKKFVKEKLVAAWGLVKSKPSVAAIGFAVGFVAGKIL